MQRGKIQEMNTIEIKLKTDDSLTETDLDFLQSQIQFIVNTQAIRILDFEINQHDETG